MPDQEISQSSQVPAPLVTSKQLGQLRTAISDGDECPVLIVIHDYPDPDALASALALQTLSRSWGIASTIAYGGGIGRPENNAMVKLLNIEMTPFSTLPSMDRFKGALFIDTQPAAQNQSLPSGVPVLGVIDHHRLSEDSVRRDNTRSKRATRQNAFFDIRLEVGSSSTLACGYLQAAGMIPDARLATALFVGIKTDTDSLMRDSTPADIEAYVKLVPLADMQLVHGISRPPLPRDYFTLLVTALNHTRLYGHSLISDCGSIEAPDVISSISDLMIRKGNVLYALAHGIKNGRHYFSLRTKPPREDATRVMLALVGDEGRGGGHNLSAGGFTNADSEQAPCPESVRARFLAATGMAGVPGEQLL